MIELNLIGGNKIVINAELIKSIKSQPHTTSITLTTDDKIIVENSVDEIINRVIEYKRLIYCQNFEHSRIVSV